jgi:hypothetical protein
MATEDQRGTNAADSAPGVDDGKATGRRPEHFTRPGGRGRVWIWVALSALILLGVFLARPMSTGRDDNQGSAVRPALTSQSAMPQQAPPQ